MNMDYNFVKDIYVSIVDGLKVDNSILENFVADRENSFILKHNIKAISQILKFLNSSENVFILNGFMGSGKTYVADCILDFINENVLIFRNSYQEAINLDDVLHNIFVFHHHIQTLGNQQPIRNQKYLDHIILILFLNSYE